MNYGIPDLTGKTLSGLEVFDLEQALKRSIVQFEPRILPDTLVVRGLLDDDTSVHNCPWPLLKKPFHADKLKTLLH